MSIYHHNKREKGNNNKFVAYNSLKTRYTIRKKVMYSNTMQL